MSRRRQIYEGKAKVLFEGPEPGTLVQFFKDDATAFNKKKHEVVDGKGVLNNRISEHIFTHLNRMGIPTHFIRRLNMREQLIREVEIIPLEVIVRNFAAGSLSKRLGLEEGTALPRPIVDRVNAELNKSLKSKDMEDKLAVDGVSPAGGTPAILMLTAKAGATINASNVSVTSNFNITSIIPTRVTPDPMICTMPPIDTKIRIATTSRIELVSILFWRPPPGA